MDSSHAAACFSLPPSARNWFPERRRRILTISWSAAVFRAPMVNRIAAAALFVIGIVNASAPTALFMSWPMVLAGMTLGCAIGVGVDNLFKFDAWTADGHRNLHLAALDRFLPRITLHAFAGGTTNVWLMVSCWKPMTSGKRRPGSTCTS